jgi:DNA-binding SARP family transcriptional activator
LEVRLLGELQARFGGQDVATPASRRAWALLGWLALHPGEHARGAVAARFWPDVLDSSARASLRSAMWALRRALGDGAAEALVAARDTISLSCTTDLEAFNADVAAGRLEQAFALSRGPLLADLDEDWVLEARDEHAERLGAALARLASAAATPQDAVAWARRRLAIDPLDEEAARDLMRRLVAAGDRPGALVVYERLSERLRAGLGLAPSGETRALAAAVRQTPAVSDGEPGRPGGEAPRPASLDGAPLVGRDRELGELLALWASVQRGQGALAVIEGEGGIGKTRLAGELVASARARSARTATCATLDLGGAPPFGMWAELLSDLTRELIPPAPEASWPEELARLAPALTRRLGRAAAAPADVAPDLARARMFEAGVELLEHATSDRPLVLLFDDVHLADASSLELAAYVARRIASLPVLLVLTRRLTPRRDEVDVLLHAARARGVATAEIALAPLRRADVERLVGTVVSLDAPDRERVIAAADGNPLLALESARATALGDEGPPSSLRAAVRTAVLRLSEPARHVAALAAVAGRELKRAELAGLAQPDAVRGAIDSGLFRSVDGRFGFRHALLREAVYADLDDGDRLALHELLGMSLVGRAAESARHLRLAGRDDLAGSRLMQAAADALRTTAYGEAAAFLQEAAELLADDPRPRLELAEVCARLGRRDAALGALDAALELIDATDASAHADAHLRAARWFCSSLCDPSRTLRACQAGLDGLDAAAVEAPESRAELLGMRAWSEVTIHGADAADGTLAVLEELEPRLEPSLRRVHDIETVRGFAALARGRPDEAEQHLVSAGEAAEREGRPDMAYGGWANAAVIAASTGALERALAHAQRGARIASGLPVLEFQMLGVRAYALARLDRHEQARADCDRQAELAQRVGSAELAALADHDAGLLALLAGDNERAAELLARALAADPPVQRAEARLRRAEALARLGRVGEADAEIRAATQEPIRPSQRPAVLVARMTFAQALGAAARGDRELAVERFQETADHWQRLGGEHGWARDLTASLVDLGRPPVSGIVDTRLELSRTAAELRSITPVRT